MRARRSGDPRDLGEAQAALAPWWAQAAPPAQVRLLRAMLRQSQHHVDLALADLEAVAADATAPPAAASRAGTGPGRTGTASSSRPPAARP